MPNFIELDSNESKNFNRTFRGTNCTELNQNCYKGSFVYSDGLSFQIQNEKKRTHFSVTKLNTAPTGVFTYQQKNFWLDF